MDVKPEQNSPKGDKMLFSTPLLPGLTPGTTMDKTRRRVGWKSFPMFKMSIIYLALLSGWILVEGSEIESCTRLMHSGSGGVGNNGVEHSVIQCHIRTLHPELDFLNLTSSIPGNGGMMMDVMSITWLKIICNDVLFFESAVSPGQLSSLGELHELTIEKCKLTSFPSGFLTTRHLRRLTINTGNSDWGQRSLEIAPTAFHGLPQLRHLHLGFNHMWSIPDRTLCPLGLFSLNLTNNQFSDIDDLGLGLPWSGILSDNSSSSHGLPCLGDLKSLDLSYNYLRTLGNLEKMKRLQELRVDHNWLEELDDKAFTGLGQLRLLNASSNRLVALPAKLFQPCKSLQSLDLRNNSLTALSPGLLNALEMLQVLDLSMNSLSSQWITAEAFKSLVRLVILNLSHNQLTHLGPLTFHDLYSLQILQLENNLISSIDNGAFASMTNLHSLNLGRNRLVHINSNMLNGLYVLHKLILDYNQIQTIDTAAFRNCTSLQDLGLVGNKLPEVPEALRGLQLIRTLDLGENRISSLNNESFHGMSQLYGLRLVDNQLEEIPKGLCDPLGKLRVLNAAQNRIHKISSSAFISCPELKVLRLDSNQLEMLPATLAPQLPNLLWLNVSENRIRWADYSLLPTPLEWFDVSHNQLETLGGAARGIPTGSGGVTGNVSQSSNQNVRLRVVDASHNKLTTLDHHTVPANLEVLRLSHNQLRKILPDTFSRSQHLRRVELLGNQLENIPLNALRLPPIPAGKPLPEFFLGGNPFICDCEMEYLKRINQLSALRQHPTVLDIDSIVCRLANSRTLTHRPLPDMTNQEFVCPYKSHCFALCHCCEFDACDCEMTCPGNCSCYHDTAWSSNIVECSNLNYENIPARIPMDASEIYLDGNNITELKPHSFIGRKNLRILFLNSSRVEKISNNSYNGLMSLQILDLSDNNLKILRGYEFNHLTKLRELYLQDNRISTISNVTFLNLKSLEIIRLDGNRLVTFAVVQLSLNPYLVEIALSRNLWTCDCQFLHNFYNWVVRDNSRKIVDIGQLQCHWNTTTTNKPGPHLIDYNRTCGSSWALMGIDGSGFDFTFSPLPLVMGLLSLVLLFIIIIILVILCRDNVRIWIFSHFGIRMCPSATYAEDDEKIYDAYLLYSQKDEEFVAQKIADELETNDSYRLCLHYRDLISETGDLKEMMVGAVENSKSVVIILSRNFIQGEWSSGEYRGAFHAVLKKSQKQSRDINPKKVVIVFIDDIPPMDINPDIRSWVRHNRIQVIKWSISSQDQRKHRKFWSKLKYCLPAPSSHYHSNITSNTTTTSSASSGGGGSDTQGGILATLKYTTNGNNEHDHIIVDELSRTMTMNINNKLWPYATNFVALPPKNQIIPNSPSSQTGYGQQGHYNNHNNQNYSMGSSHHTSPHHHHYHTPLPLMSSNPPKSPPSSQSTDSTTTNGGDDSNNPNNMVHTPTSFSLMMQQMQMQGKSPLPVPKSLLYSTNNSSINNSNGGGGNGGVMNNSASSSSSSGVGVGGESYLSLEGEHVYSTLDPPSPQPHQQQQQLMNSLQHQQQQSNSNRVLNNIHLPNGYTYQPQITPHPQWHPTNSGGGSGSHHPPSGGGQTPKGTLNFGSSKSYKQKDGNNPVQTYLV